MPVKETKSKRQKHAPAAASPAAAPAPAPRPPFAALVFLERHCMVLFLALVVIGSLRIVSTYAVFSHTWDEPIHIVTGVEWLRNGTYRFDPQHPPLTRIAVGLGPSLMGMPPPTHPNSSDDEMFAESRRILYGTGRYQQILTAARLGTLPFFWIGCAVVFLWGKRYFSDAAAVLAVFLFSFFPTVLAHAGLATTDMACTAMLAAVFLAGCVFVEEPSARNAAIFGVCGGLAILSKFSVLVYFPVSVAIALAWCWIVERPTLPVRKLAPLLGMAAAIVAVMVCAAYRFHLSDLWDGIGVVSKHNASGHWSYLLGEISRQGHWYFFPVAIAVKTPIPFLLLAAAGIWLAVRNRGGRRPWLAVAFAAGILAVALWSHINIGLRHILPMYTALAILGGAALASEWGRSRLTIAIGSALLVWMAATSLAAHPDYLGYFNLIAGSQPENILVDSDLDWGQDVSRLGRRLHELGAHEVTFIPGDKTDFSRQPGFEGITVNQQMSWAVPSAGWNAVELTGLKLRRLGFMDTHPELTLWPNVIPPRERIGTSILLWYFPPGGSTPTIPVPKN